MEASALQAPAGLTRARLSVSAPLLRVRSDDQLVALFRAGHDDAFRAIHDRYRQRLFAYTRQMLPGSSQDAEDVLQDVFVRAYSGLRANRRELALRPWLYRVAHNRCIDELRRPIVAPTAIIHELGAPAADPIAQVEQRESLRRLIADLLRLPTQQRSALLMRELGGMSYAEVAGAMDVTVPAVKSLLVRARIGLTLAAEARDTACVTIRDEIALAHDRGARCSGTVRRHVTDCGGCRDFQSQLRRSRHQFAALTPTLGPIGVLANLLGWGGGAAGGGAAASGGATATTGALVGGGTAGAVGTLGAGASHVAALIAATVVTAGSAVAIQHSIAPSAPRRSANPPPAAVASTPPAVAAATSATNAYASSGTAPASTAPASASGTGAASKAAGGRAPAGSRAPSISGGDDIVPTATPTGGADPSSTGTADQTPSGTGATTGTAGTTTTTGDTGTTGASGSGSTTGTGSAGTTSPTGTIGSTTGATTSSTGTTGASSATTGSPSATTGTSGSTTSGIGSPPPTSAGTTTGPSSGP